MYLVYHPLVDVDETKRVLSQPILRLDSYLSERKVLNKKKRWGSTFRWTFQVSLLELTRYPTGFCS